MFGTAQKRRQQQELQELTGMVAALKRSQAVIEFALDGTILEANENFLSVMGYRLDEVQGAHHRIFVDPQDANTPAYADLWRRLNAGEFIADKFVRYAKNGARVVIEASYNPIFDIDGKPCKVVKFATDITAVEAERERRGGGPSRRPGSGLGGPIDRARPVRPGGRRPVLQDHRRLPRRIRGSARRLQPGDRRPGSGGGGHSRQRRLHAVRRQ